MKLFNEALGILIPEILLPLKCIDLTKWSVVACDQFTSQPEYWEKAEKFVGNSPSTLHMIFPEIYLERTDKDERIREINKTMQEYLDKNVYPPQKPGFIYVDRKTCRNESRKGLILAIDLERYDFSENSQSLIRATEGTVLERLPPRIKIRENAPVELPHIMVLIDDPGRTVVEPLAEKVEFLEKLYDFELMMDGMHIKGYKVDDGDMISGILNALEKLSDPDSFKSKYGANPDKGILLFAVGDGNHSLATAKVCWENLKKTLSEDEASRHPARFALVEVVNIHDDGLKFEPIHRVVFNMAPERVLEKAVEYFNKNNSQAYYRKYESKEHMQSEMEKLRRNNHSHVIPFITKDFPGIIIVDNPEHSLEVGTLQRFLDNLTGNDSNIKIDYIHGDDVVHSLGSQPGNIGFFLPPMDKHDLFKTIILDGTLPRKTFSMGEAEEKRYYLECRKIKV